MQAAVYFFYRSAGRLKTDMDARRGGMQKKIGLKSNYLVKERYVCCG